MSFGNTMKWTPPLKADHKYLLVNKCNGGVWCSKFCPGVSAPKVKVYLAYASSKLCEFILEKSIVEINFGNCVEI